MGTQAAMMSIHMLRSPTLSAMVERDLTNIIRSSQEAAARAEAERSKENTDGQV